MTYDDGSPTTPTLAHAPAWEACDHCQAPLAERQRYCVVCGARRAHADDPAGRWFVAAARRGRAPEPAGIAAGAAGAGGPSRWWFAVVLALLPVVAAAGILVGRGSGNDQQLVDALKAQKAPVVNVVGGSGGAAADASGSGASSHGGSSSKQKPSASSSAAAGDVVAKTRYGTARSLTNSRVTQQELDASRRALQHIVSSKGRAYVESQRDLPDQIVIP